MFFSYELEIAHLKNFRAFHMALLKLLILAWLRMIEI